MLHPQQTTKSKQENQDSTEIKPGSKEEQLVGENSVSKDGGNNVSAAAGASDSRLRLGVIPVRTGTKAGKKKFETYALMDSGSEVMLCHEELSTKGRFPLSKIILGSDRIGTKFNLHMRLWCQFFAHFEAILYV